MVQLYITPYYIIIITQSDHYANIESNVLCTYLVNACASTPRGPNMQHNNIECLHGVPHSMASKNTPLAKNTSKEIKWSQDAHAVSGVDMKFEKSVKDREMKGSALAPEAAALAIAVNVVVFEVTTFRLSLPAMPPRFSQEMAAFLLQKNNLWQHAPPGRINFLIRVSLNEFVNAKTNARKLPANKPLTSN